MSRNCIKCKIEIPEKRLLALPDTATCVNCSTTSAYKAITITCGEGEDTWQETKIMSESEYNAYMKIERKINEINGIPTISDFDDEFLNDSDLNPSSLDIE
jgi:hypothetical protein